MDQGVLRECLAEAFAGRMTFPESVGRMMEAGVERYHADLTRLEKAHYGVDGSTHLEAMPLTDAPAVSLSFSAEGVQAAITAIQQRQFDYPEFRRRVMAAGTASYSVFLTGRKAIYFSRAGNFLIKPFPAGK